MAEMTALTVGIYREYTTSIAPGFENKTPGITSRFEVFYDETFPEVAVSPTHRLRMEKQGKLTLDRIKEHTCLIQFTKAVS